jgi:hypothetical protein
MARTTHQMTKREQRELERSMLQRLLVPHNLEQIRRNAAEKKHKGKD